MSRPELDSPWHPSQRRFRAGILRTFVGQLGFAGISFLSAVLMARLLEPAGRGELAILILVPTLLTVVLELGQEFTGSHLASRSGSDRGRLHGNLLLFATALVVPAAGLLAIAFWLLPYLDGMLLPLVATGGVAVGAGVYLRGASGLALGSGRVRLYNASRLLLAGSFLAGVLAFWGLGHASPRAFYFAWCGAQLTVAALLGLCLRTEPLGASRRVAGEQWRAGWPVHLSNTSQFLLLRVDQLLLAGLVGTAAVGEYTVAVNVAEALWYLPAAAGLLSIPFLSGGLPEADKARALVHAFRISFWFPVAGALALASSASVLLPYVFGQSFSGAVRPFLLLLPGVVAAGIAKVGSAALIARERSAFLLRISVGAFILNLALNALLVPSLEASGAALASTASYAVLGVASLRAAAAAWDVAPLDCLRLPARLSSHTPTRTDLALSRVGGDRSE